MPGQDQQGAVPPGVILEAFYWDIPSPGAGSANPDMWWDHLAKQANTFAKSGFTAVWIPPVNKGNSGGYSSGYDPFDDYDLGSKAQKGTVPTRYGSRTQLQRACAMFRANGLAIYADIVDSHRDGDSGNFQFQYVDAFGNPSGGRFEKSFWDFYPTAPIDQSIPDQNPFDADGDFIMPTTGGKTTIDGNEWVWADYGMKQSASWLTSALDLQGYRVDDVRSSPPGWLYSFMNYGPMAGKFFVSENWDNNAGNLDGWVNQMQARSCVFDFALRVNYIAPMCGNPGGFDMSSLNGAGYTGVNPFNAVTFVENHDTDVGHDQDSRYNAIRINKLLGYALILTSEGYPCVFYRDWSTDPGCYGGGMQAQINTLIWIHQNIAAGETTQRWLNNSIYCYERLGGNHLLVALNAATVEQKITCAPGFGANVALHDYTGNRPDIKTDGSGQVTITIPALGYVAYSVTGIQGDAAPVAVATTQQYDGAPDLDIQPAISAAPVQICQIYASAGTKIIGGLSFDITDWTKDTRIDLTLTDSTGATVKTHRYNLGTAQGTALTFDVVTTGYHTFTIQSFNTPATNESPTYSLRATYTAPQTL